MVIKELREYWQPGSQIRGMVTPSTQNKQRKEDRRMRKTRRKKRRYYTSGGRASAESEI